MRKVLLLASLSMVLALVLSAPAMAQSASASPAADPCPDPNFPRETPDGCQASDLPDVEFGADASPTASPTASPAASPTASATASASASASVSVLPATGGPAVSVLALGSLALFVGAGIMAFGIVRRS